MSMKMEAERRMSRNRALNPDWSTCPFVGERGAI